MSHARLRSSQEIKRVMASRRSAATTHVVAHAAPNVVDHARVAVVAGRRVGNAVERNRAKRRVRAALRDTPVPAGCDLVVTSKAGVGSVAFDALRREVGTAVQQAARRAGIS